MSTSNKTKASVIIPARFCSSRFPGKVLTLLLSKPVIQWTYESILGANLVERVVIATDDKRVYESVISFGGEAVMTSPIARTGSDRCAEVAKKLKEEIIINLQADELLLGPEMIDELIELLLKEPLIKIGTLKREISIPEELWNRNVVKVVTDNDDYALYFSRSPIPCIRDRVFSDNESLPPHTFYKHLGIYGYRRDFLLHFASLPTSRLEELEKLEQLRALEWGFKIKVRETVYESYRIDTPEDLKNIEKVIGNGR